MMEVEVVTPEDYMGDVMGDLNRRRGIVRAWKTAGRQGRQRRSAAVRDVRLRTDLRSQTQGRATYTMEFEHYSEAAASVAEEVIAKKAA